MRIVVFFRLGQFLRLLWWRLSWHDNIELLGINYSQFSDFWKSIILHIASLVGRFRTPAKRLPRWIEARKTKAVRDGYDRRRKMERKGTWAKRAAIPTLFSWILRCSDGFFHRHHDSASEYEEMCWYHTETAKMLQKCCFFNFAAHKKRWLAWGCSKIGSFAWTPSKKSYLSIVKRHLEAGDHMRPLKIAGSIRYLLFVKQSLFAECRKQKTQDFCSGLEA